MIALPTSPTRRSVRAGSGGSYASVISRAGLSLPWLTAAKAPMPAARISSGPSASKRRCSLPAAISSAQAARSSGVSSFAGALTSVTAAVRPGRGHVRTPGRLGRLRRRPVRRARGARSARARSSLGLPAAVLVGAEHGAVDDRLALLRRGQAVLLDDPGDARSADVERPRGHPGGGRPQAVGVERRACRARPRRPAARPGGRRRGGGSRAPRLPSARLPRRVGSDAPRPAGRDPAAAAASSTGSRTAKARTSASTPPGGASTTSIFMSEAGCYRSRAPSCGACPVRGIGARPATPDTEGSARAPLHPLPTARIPPLRGRIPLPIEALLLGGLHRAG